MLQEKAGNSWKLAKCIVASMILHLIVTGYQNGGEKCNGC